MIKFFRHIRRSLINENKMGKYFKYAIGEILLVVIGILIALGINNWNEKLREAKNERFLLQKLQEENSINMQVLASDSVYRQRLPNTLSDFNGFLNHKKLEKHTDSLQHYLSEIMRSTSYTFTDNNLVNYINLHKENTSGINRELATLQNHQKDIQIISEKGVELKIDNFYQAIKKDVDFNNLTIHSYDHLGTLEFRNDVLILLSVEDEITLQFNRTLKQMRKVDSLITKRLMDD